VWWKVERQKEKREEDRDVKRRGKDARKKMEIGRRARAFGL